MSKVGPPIPREYFVEQIMIAYHANPYEETRKAIRERLAKSGVTFDEEKNVLDSQAISD